MELTFACFSFRPANCKLRIRVLLQHLVGNWDYILLCSLGSSMFTTTFLCKNLLKWRMLVGFFLTSFESDLQFWKWPLILKILKHVHALEFLLILSHICWSWFMCDVFISLLWSQAINKVERSSSNVWNASRPSRVFVPVLLEECFIEHIFSLVKFLLMYHLHQLFI